MHFDTHYLSNLPAGCINRFPATFTFEYFVYLIDIRLLVYSTPTSNVRHKSISQPMEQKKD